MEKNDFSNKELSDSERKTITSLIDIGENGSIIFVEKPNSEIHKKTGENRDTQFRILKRLDQRGIVEKKGVKYSLKSEYKDLAKSSVIKNQINELENNGIFNFSPFTIFGIKEQEKWYKYPEIQYLHEAMDESRYLLYRIKQIKAIFLLRDFIPIWNKFLELDIHPAIKYYLWDFFVNHLSYLQKDKSEQEDKDDFVADQLKILSQLKVNKKNEIEKILREKYNDYLNELNKNLSKGRKKIESYKFYSKKLCMKMLEYKKVEKEVMIDYMLENLSKEELEIIYWMVDYVTDYYHREINNVGIWIDLEKLKVWPFIKRIPWKTPYDNAEKDFRSRGTLYNDQSTINVIQKIFREIKKEEVDYKLNNFKYIYDDRNYERLLSRLKYIIENNIKKPKPVLFITPELKKIKKQIVDLAKKESCSNNILISHLINKGLLKSDTDIFSFIEEYFETEFYYQALDKKRK